MCGMRPIIFQVSNSLSGASVPRLPILRSLQWPEIPPSVTGRVRSTFYQLRIASANETQEYPDQTAPFMGRWIAYFERPDSHRY